MNLQYMCAHKIGVHPDVQICTSHIIHLRYTFGIYINLFFNPTVRHFVYFLLPLFRQSPSFPTNITTVCGMDPFVETLPGSDSYIAADSFLQFCAQLLRTNASPFVFGRSVYNGNDCYFVDVVAGGEQILRYVDTRQGMPFCTRLRIYMGMYPEEFERASNIFLPDSPADEAIHGIVTNNARLPINVVVAPGGVWIEICDSRAAHRNTVYSRLIVNTMHANRDNYLHGNARGNTASYSESDGSLTDSADN